MDGKDYDLEIERILDLRVGDVLEETAKLYPDQEALISFDGTRRIDYRTFDEDSKAFAKYLLSIGIKKATISVCGWRTVSNL